MILANAAYIDRPDDEFDHDEEEKCVRDQSPFAQFTVRLDPHKPLSARSDVAKRGAPRLFFVPARVTFLNTGAWDVALPSFWGGI
jgi:hypothetical protein